MKKKLDTSNLTNELAQHSSFFKKKDDIEEQKVEEIEEEKAKIEQNPDLDQKLKPNVRTVDRTDERFLDNQDSIVEKEPQIEEKSEKRLELLDEFVSNLTQASPKKHTERYSFEIYSDLKDRLEDIIYLYKKRTGYKITNSRIIREALEIYLDELEKQLNKK